jgi:hypothetical protein
MHYLGLEEKTFVVYFNEKRSEKEYLIKEEIE